jgi:hypothetical protein
MSEPKNTTRSARFFARLPGARRSPPGLEWKLLKRLPAILLVGTAVPVGVALALWWAAPSPPSPADERDLLLMAFRVAGVLLLHWTLVLTVAIGCVIVIVMKGPGYVADAYPPPAREPAGPPRAAPPGGGPPAP